MLFLILSLLYALHAAIISDAAGPVQDDLKTMISNDLMKDAASAVINNDLKSVEILLSLQMEIPNLFTSNHFVHAVKRGSDQMLKTLLTHRFASKWLAFKGYQEIREAHKVGRSVQIIGKMLLSTTSAHYLYPLVQDQCHVIISADDDEVFKKYQEEMVTVAKYAKLEEIAEILQAGVNPNIYDAEITEQVDNSEELSLKLTAHAKQAVEDMDLAVIKLLGNCPQAKPIVHRAFRSVIEGKDEQMILNMCKIPCICLNYNNYEAARTAAECELPLKVMATLFQKRFGSIRNLPVGECVTDCIENELVPVLRHMSNFVEPPKIRLGLESLIPHPSKHGVYPGGPNFVDYIETSLKKQSVVPLLQILLDEHRPFIQEVTVDLKMWKYQDLIQQAHKSGNHVLRDELLKLALLAYSNLPIHLDDQQFSKLTSVIRGIPSLIELSRLGPALNHDILRMLLNNLFDLSFA